MDLNYSQDGSDLGSINENIEYMRLNHCINKSSALTNVRLDTHFASVHAPETSADPNWQKLCRAKPKNNRL